MDYRGTQDFLGLAVPKNRPKNLFDGFSNRTNTIKRANRPARSSRESRSVAGSSSGISLEEQYRYLQAQHQELIVKYNILNQDHKKQDAQQREMIAKQEREYKALEECNNQLKEDNKRLKEAYDELQENYKSLEDSQKSFNAGKLLVYLKLKRRTDKETLEKRNIIRNEACFNTHLEDVMLDTQLQIPKIIVECVKVVESSEKFMQAAGLYRVSGNHNTIQNLRYDINENNYKKLRKQKSPHEVCGLLKLFLRELKEPLISLALVGQIIPGPADMINGRTLKVLELVNSLDDLRKRTLRYLIEHLTRVVAEPANEMDSRSLGILMSSCIFNETLSDVCPQRFEMLSAVPRECIVTMIENFDEVFL